MFEVVVGGIICYGHISHFPHKASALSICNMLCVRRLCCVLSDVGVYGWKPNTYKRIRCFHHHVQWTCSLIMQLTYMNEIHSMRAFVNETIIQ